MKNDRLTLYEPAANSTSTAILTIVPVELRRHNFAAYHSNPLEGGPFSLYYTFLEHRSDYSTTISVAAYINDKNSELKTKMLGPAGIIRMNPEECGLWHSLLLDYSYNGRIFSRFYERRLPDWR